MGGAAASSGAALAHGTLKTDEDQGFYIGGGGIHPQYVYTLRENQRNVRSAGVNNSSLAEKLLYDFHTHTCLSDGVLSPMELIHRAFVIGYTALGIADHCGAGNMERFIRELRQEADVAARYWGFPVLVGVELTHVPAASIAELAARAKALGADHVVVHGETPVEPVEAGTNLAAAQCPDVDILAHPGLLSEEAAQAAAQNDIFIEITAKDGHSLGNGRVVQTALAANAKLLLNSDTHTPGQLLTPDFARRVALCAGVPENMLSAILVEHPQQLIERCLKKQR